MWVQGLCVAQPIRREKASLPEHSKRSPSRMRPEICARGWGFSVVRASSAIGIYGSVTGVRNGNA
jgi:hypothetical protein